MTDQPAGPGGVSVRLTLTIFDRRVDLTLPLPPGEVELTAMIPALQALTDVTGRVATQVCAERGQPLSCKAGCGVCCRQLVPVSACEAWYLRRAVEDLPAERRDRIERRCREAMDGFVRAGLPGDVTHWASLDREKSASLGRRCFALGIACPFLEEESCSMYPHRPLVCREVLVVSPAENCQGRPGQQVDRLVLPGQLSRALYRLSHLGEGKVWWVPLVAALDWARQHEPPADLRTGPQWLERVLQLAR